MSTDICVNFANRQFTGEETAILERAFSVGVTHCIFVATDLATSRVLSDWKPDSGRDDLPTCRSTAGVHPHDADSVEADWYEQLRSIARKPNVAAIGETGLDFNRNYSTKSNQRRCFDAQIELAHELQKPLFVHDRESGGEVADRLANAQLAGVVIHCFTGTEEELERYLAAGYFIGITGWIADKKRGTELRRLIARIPLEQLLVETDAPFLRPQNASIGTSTTISQHGLSGAVSQLTYLSSLTPSPHTPHTAAKI
ncbi:MAG: hydrolase TatD [Pseudomonadales bacterium]|nr:hydrolase TatD [Pseudomonadales bacterium]